ncbi:MAG TPA: DUF1206 domain-containing protein, partial [Acidimicrobiales bacterium]|nr:DUF1206 domain-containing protein [Acidimicrobiales bacterium]
MSPVATGRADPARPSTPARVAEGVDRTTVVRQLARLGLGARAAVYLILGVLVLEIAVRGRPSSQADSQGAFRAVGNQAGGRELLVVLGVGLLAYAGWRAVQAITGSTVPQGNGGWTRAGRAGIAAVYLLLCVEVAELVFGRSSQGGPAQHPSSSAARVLDWPLGQEILGLVGVVVGGAGAALLVWGLLHDYSDELDPGQRGRLAARAARPTGALGNAARGLALALVGASLVSSALSGDPHHAKSLDAALQSLAGDSGGPVLLGGLG